MSITTAIITAGIVVALGIAIGLSVIGYFLFRFVGIIAVLKATDNVSDAAKLMRAVNSKSPKPPEQTPEKIAAEMPDIGIHQMGEDPKARKNIRKKLNATPDNVY